MSNEINKELIRLFLEASGLVIKLTHKLENDHVVGAENHIAAAKDFIQRNKLYKQALECELQRKE